MSWRGRSIFHIQAAIQTMPPEELTKTGAPAMDSPLPFYRAALFELGWSGRWPDDLLSPAQRQHLDRARAPVATEDDRT